MSTTSTSESGLIADLNDLLQLDHDAVEAYTVAIDTVREARYREQLVEYCADHKRHIEELAALVRARGGLPMELPHPTAPLKLLVQALGAAPGDVTLLLAFKAVEGQARDKYRRFAAKTTYPPEVREVIRRGANDESKHYQWVEQALKEQGAGAGTLPHGLASAVEGLHKLIADPIEAFERKVAQHVGDVVGTTRDRGGSAAPSPADAAKGASGGGSASGGATNPMQAMSDAVQGMASDIADMMRGGARAAGGAATAAGAAGAAGTAAAPDAPPFLLALRQLEETGDIERMVALYAETSETSGPNEEQPHRGREGARRFWRMYRDSFASIHSTFSKVAEAPDGTVMLEWTSEGRALAGGAIGYAGVSVVEMQAGRITRFRTYFDTRELEVKPVS